MDALKRKADALREQLWKKKDDLNDTTLYDVAKNTPPVIRDPPVKLQRTLKGHMGKVYSLHWAGDSKHLVSASQDGKLIVWDALTTHKRYAIALKSAWVMTCAYAPSGNLVASGGLDNVCSVHNLRALNGNASSSSVRSCRELVGHTGFLSCCRFLDDRQVLTASGDTTCALWDVENGRPSAVFTGHVSDVMSLAICPTQPNIFVSGGCDTMAKVWDIRTGKCTQTFAGHDNDINSVSFAPNGESFGTGSDDATCRIFDLRADRELALYADDAVGCGVTSVAFSNSGRLLFAGYDDGQCVGWDTFHRRPSMHLQRHENRVSCVGVAPDGNAVATASWDALVRVFA